MEKIEKFLKNFIEVELWGLFKEMGKMYSDGFILWGKMLKALFTLTFYIYEYDEVTITVPRSKHIDDFKMHRVIRTSTISGLKSYKFGDGYMFNNPHNNRWKPYFESSDKGPVIECSIM